MKFNITHQALALVVLSMAFSCAIVQRESPEKKARELIVSFQQSLSQPASSLLKYFDTQQSNRSLLAAINILQNNDSSSIHCESFFNNMTLEVIQVEETEAKVNGIPSTAIRVSVPTKLTSRDVNIPSEQEISLVFLVSEKKGKYFIYKLEGESFYNAFISLKHEIEYASHQENEIKEREAIYAMAEKIGEKYDHVVWYAQYNGQVFFYVVNGDWNEEALTTASVPRPNFSMGLVNESGNEIIPVAFEKIGTLGAEVYDAVEVKGAEGYGYYSLGGDTLVQALYTQIIPYPKEHFWMVQMDDQMGWIDQQKIFHEGFPNQEIEKKVREFAYLPSGITISEGGFALCEVPNPDGAGSGLFISPSYWVEAGLLEPFKFGITTTTSTDAPIGGWTEYIEIGETIFQSINETLGVILASFKERYLEGREEFYHSNKVLFTDANHHVLNSVNLGGEDLNIKMLPDQLIELSATRISDPMEMGMAMEPSSPRFYRYYRLTGSELSSMNSYRTRPETEFVKLDSSYIMGNFSRYNYESNLSEEYFILSPIILQNMRNEILAEYGYIFLDEEDNIKFNYYKWYDPRFETEEEFENQLSDIDRHNLKFLAKIIDLLDTTESDV